MRNWKRRVVVTMAAGVAGALWLGPGPRVEASSHMDAPLITLDDAANTTDVYAFVSQEGEQKYLTAALSVYPFEEPGIGPNVFRFDDNVKYTLHVALQSDIEKGLSTVAYDFVFRTEFLDDSTILQAFRAGPNGTVIEALGDEAQNLRQTYTVTEIDRRRPKKRQALTLGEAPVPPNNQGRVTPYYNEQDSGDNPARPGVTSAGDLDRYTAAAIRTLEGGIRVFAGQRDDAFYADVQAVFDGLNLRTPPDPVTDAQRGFNVHTLAIQIPLDRLGEGAELAGVFATTSRRKLTKRSTKGADKDRGKWVQVARQGNPLFNELFVPLKDKALYNRTLPSRDRELFEKYALEPEMAGLINAVLFGGQEVARTTGRTDLAAIFIPDLIKVDLTTPAARLAGGGPAEFAPTIPDDPGFSRLSIFGSGEGDVLDSTRTGGKVPGGWPNGRRFGDDVVDIGVIAVALTTDDVPVPHLPELGPGIDQVTSNDLAFNKVFPYAATPHNGRNRRHDPDPVEND